MENWTLGWGIWADSSEAENLELLSSASLPLPVLPPLLRELSLLRELWWLPLRPLPCRRPRIFLRNYLHHLSLLQYLQHPPENEVLRSPMREYDTHLKNCVLLPAVTWGMVWDQSSQNIKLIRWFFWCGHTEQRDSRVKGLGQRTRSGLSVDWTFHYSKRWPKLKLR